MAIEPELASFFQSLLKPPDILGFVLVVDERQRQVIDYRMMDLGDVLALLATNGLLPSPKGGQGGKRASGEHGNGDRR